MRYKRKLIVLIIAVCVYIILSVIYNKLIVKTDDKKVYVLTKDIQKGKEITVNDLKEIILKTKDEKNEYITDLSILSTNLAGIDLYKNQILTNNMIINKNNYIKVNEDEEIVPIKIKTSEDGASYNVSRNDLVNIYYTGKTDYANNILEGFKGSNIISGGNPGYISVILFKSIKVVGVYDKYGNEINDNNKDQGNEIVMDTILISTNSKMAMIIYNLQRYGDFSLSLVN